MTLTQYRVNNRLTYQELADLLENDGKSKKNRHWRTIYNWCRAGYTVELKGARIAGIYAPEHRVWPAKK